MSPALRQDLLTLTLPLFLLYFVLSSLCVGLFKLSGGIAGLWLPNALGIVALLHFPGKWSLILPPVALANLLANLAFGASLQLTLFFVAANLVEILIGYWALRVHNISTAFDSDMSSTVRVLWAGVFMPPLLASVIGAAAFGTGELATFQHNWLRWYVSDTIGLLVMLPLLLNSSREAWRNHLAGRQSGDVVMLLALTMGTAYFSLVHLPYPFAYIMLPLLLVALRLSVFGTALIGGVNALFILTLIGLDWLSPAGAREASTPLHHLPIALTLVPAYFLAVVIEQLRASRAQAAISEARFRGAMEFSAIGMALVSLEGHWLKVNPTLCGWLGYTEQELATMRFQDVTYPDDLQDDLDLVHDILSGRINTYKMEKRYICRNGRVLWVELAVSVVRDEAGTPLYFVSQIENIDQRKRAEEALQLDRARLEQLAQGNGLGQWSWDAERGLLWDGRMHALHAVTEANFRPALKTWAYLMHPLDGEGFEHAVRFAANGETQLDVEVRVVLPRGDMRHLRVAAKLLPGRPGSPAQLLGSCCDMTDARRAKEMLFQAQERLQTTIAAISDAVLLTDALCTVSYMNPAAEAMTGWTLAMAKGVPYEQVFRALHSETGEPVGSPIKLSLQQMHGFCRDEGVTLISKTGERYEIRHTAAPVRASNGEVTGAVLVWHDQTSSHKLQKELSFSATHDALTGVYNRARFEQELQRAVVNAGERNCQHALCFIDIDHFKVVNDSAGHAAGDMLLRELALLLMEQVRNSDTIARIGGDEFALLLLNCDLGKAQEMGNKIIQAVTSLRFPWEGHVYVVGASIGIAPILPSTQGTGEIMGQADVACYAAQQAGGNRVSLYYAGQDDVKRQHHEILLASGLREALEKHRFTLYAQEIVPTASHADFHRHFELLLRMYDHDGGLMSPGVFIPAAERFGLMGSIDRWVIQEVLGNLGPALAAHSHVSVGINLSANSFNDAQFLPYLLQQIAQSAMAPRQLHFEVTETALMNQLSVASHILKTLRELGCKVALDDFGAGLSSFNYLKHFAVDIIKIDGSFVRNLDRNPTDAAIVATINQLAHQLGAATVGEFVESQEIFDCLAKLGVDYAQGYAVGRPIALDTVLAELQAGSKVRQIRGVR
ncbi:diguanylate cyclase/phosphodiesterase [Chitinimonas prasina]|uniref:Diguanylate cyclase/phosphodiesterase n=1 Tax=Chitinimonas prasina TaxID=1434937 RepID=A0ABQ5YGL4_9NEIS|nr:diguanylate cyclase [Chitinimonas prasina]GLR13839.1 diguanylate cyclase/phosphodiesterase [Chitinimonas prasina]